MYWYIAIVQCVNLHTILEKIKKIKIFIHILSYKANMSGDTNIPRSREAMELRAILQGLQDNRWPIVYNTESGTFENRSSFGDQFTRPVSQQSTRTQASQG